MTEIQNIRIDQEFKSLIPPLTLEEYTQLESNILTDGCRDPLVVWGDDAECILLDGHNRYEICQRHKIEFLTVYLELPDRSSALNWIINNQLGRRNLHPDQASYLRGKRYNSEKQQGKRTDLETSGQNDQKLQTHEHLAEEYKVSPRTITRDGQYAAAVDTLQSEGINPQSIIAHEPKSAVVEFAKLIAPEPELPPTPLLPAEPPKAKDPIVAAVTEKVKAGEMTVMEAAKEIKAATSTGSFHVSQGNNDWYTPTGYIEAARTVMGGIDLDPASSDIAQESIKATAYFTEESNGLDKPWNGRVWLNPPFSMPLIEQFVDKLLKEWKEGRVSQATVVTNNATDTGWFHSLLAESKLACLTKGRVKFYSATNDIMAPRQGQVFFYFGDRPDVFTQVFSGFGAVVRI